MQLWSIRRRLRNEDCKETEMRRKLIVAIVLIVLMCVPVKAADWAIYGLNMPEPEHNNSFDNAFGVEVQPRFGEGPLKFGLSVGVTQWDAEDSDVTAGWWIFQERTQISGNLQAFSLGAALLYELPLGDSLRLVGEAGVKHHLMNSDVEMKVTNLGGTSVSELDYDNASTCELGANLEFEITKNVAGLIGAVYVFDLNHDHVKSAGEKLALTNGLEGTVFRAGLVFRTP